MNQIVIKMLIELFRQIRRQWPGFLRWVQKTWWRLAIREKTRTASGVMISIIVHAAVISAYFGLATLDRPAEPPIREINFFDLNEEVATKTLPVKIAKHKPQSKKADENENLLAANAASSPSAQNVPPGEQRIFLDAPRKQAPISLDRIEPVANRLAAPNDLLKISPAKGMRNDNQVARAIEIDLNKKLSLSAATKVGGAIQVANHNEPEINLTGKLLEKPAKNNSIKLEKTAAQIDLDNAEMKPNQTQTYITGPLANRTIVEKIIPEFPPWAKRKGIGATISLQFTVMEDGRVKENIIVERTSGSGEWDQLVVQSLRKWRFIELNRAGLRQDQTGVITFQFVI